MQRIIGMALAAAGVVLLVLGISAADSVASDISRFFTGNPTDRSVWLMEGGVVGIAAGGVMAGMTSRQIRRT
ncbi:MAG: DUF3185 family protein [Phycisphaerales bacterium]|nr:DUF3185 family protein [Phycisphaerales bacterium]